MKLILLIVGILLGWIICSLPLALIVGKLLKRARKRAEGEEIEFLFRETGILWKSDLRKIKSIKECLRIMDSIENLRSKVSAEAEMAKGRLN